MNAKDSIIVDTTDVNSNPKGANTDVEMPDTTKSGTYDKSYTEKKLYPAVYPLNDTSEVLYFEDSIHGNFCSLYIKSEIDVVDSTRKPINFLNLFKNEDDKEILIINGSNVRLASKITDRDLMLPTSLGIFKKSDRTFLLIKMNLVSSIGGDYWYNLLLELDTTSHVISQKGIETTGEIPFSQVIQGIK